MNRKVMLCVALVIAPLLVTGLALSQSDTQPDIGKTTDAKKPANAMEEALEKALKQNPDILVAEAKLREAEAELNRVRQQVLAKIVATYADIEATRRILEEAKAKYSRLKSIRQTTTGIVTDEELGAAEATIAKYKGELAQKEAQLPYLVGKDTPLTSRLESPPFLKTYSVPKGQAEPLVKALQELFPKSSNLRISAVDGNQIVVYADTLTHAHIAAYLQAALSQAEQAKAADVKVPNAEKLRAALATPVAVNFRDISDLKLKDVIYLFQLKIEGVNLLLAKDLEDRSATDLPKLTAPVSLGAAFQLIEDTLNVRFIVRDYGIVGVAASDISPGLLLLSDFIKHTAEKPAKEKSK